MRKTKSAAGSADENEDEDEEAEEAAERTIPVLTEEWEQWFSQEWIGWVLWGIPFESPTEYWANQPASEGPTDTENFITDDNGKRMSKKPPGRNYQRAREATDSNNSTMLAHRLIQVDQELHIANSSHNLRIIEWLRLNATTDDEIDEANEYCKEFLLHKGALLKKRLATNKATREKEASTASTTTPSTTMLIVARCTSRVLSTARCMPVNHTPEENFGESIKSLYSFGYVLFIV